MGVELGEIFNDALNNSLFKNKSVLQVKHIPDLILHREEEIKGIAGILAPVLREERPSNLFIYGKTGTGKTLTIQHITKQLLSISEKRNIPLKICYLNCKLKRTADTEYRLVAELCRQIFNIEVPSTGLPTDEVYKTFIDNLEKEKFILILILDEIDQLVNKSGDEILYNLTRLNTQITKSEISFIGISNDLTFTENIEPRARSSLGEEEITFDSYNALQLKQILEERAKVAFREDVIKEGVIEKCAAYSVREHGDARRALDLLRVAGELAERNNEQQVEVKHIDEAQEKIEKDIVIDSVTKQPIHLKIVLYSIISICSKEPKNSKEPIFTGGVYEKYRNYCKDYGIIPLTQRRVSDLIAELDMSGIINTKVISKGRYGRTRKISLSISDSITLKIEEILKEGLGI